jgi:predicted alpha/beta superfamily hydrolase
MLHRLNLVPLLVIPVLTAAFVVRERIVDVPWTRDLRTLENLPPVDRFTLQSAHTGATYRIYVQVPHFYEETEARYPVFYALQAPPDARVYSEMVLPLLRRGQIPEAIIVSITTPARAGGLARLIAARNRRAMPEHSWVDDLTFHTNPEDPSEGGGADAFVAFLEKELMPRIDSEYRTDRRDRGIGGMNLGGSFAVSMSYRRPGFFKRAVAIAPNVRFADYAIVQELRTMDPPRRREGSTRLYVGIGEEEFPVNLAEFEILRDVLNLNQTDAVTFETEMLRGRTRQTQIVPAAQSGLKFVYED